MLAIVGALIVIASVFGGYAGAGGHLEILWQPFEIIIICGAALGAFIIANSTKVITGAMMAPIMLLKGEKFKKEGYLELLGLLFTIFKLAKSKGMLALEQHVENPTESDIFNSFPTFNDDHHAVEFLCDYLRLLTLGTDNATEIEALMDLELDTHHEEMEQISGAILGVGDALPAFGIVAAVLGVIHTMGIISEPPEVLGHAIGGALVGTFLGIFVAYGFASPVGAAVKGLQDAEAKYYFCMKTGLLSYIQGYAPAICVEFARKTIYSHNRPTFYEVEEAMDNLPSPTASK